MDVTSDHRATPRISNDPGGAAGIDLKYGVTRNLVADVTVNTDFAQVEADEQQVNLTRFSLFFPEKREFFPREPGGCSRSAGRGPVRSAGGGSTPVLFYSRRIGLAAGDHGAPVEVPIHAGGRLTGRVGQFSVGALNMQTGDAPSAAAQATNFTVVRVKRDLLRRSSVGGIFTRRGRHEGRRPAERNVRPRRHVLLLRRPDNQYVLGADAHARAAGRRRQLSDPARLCRRPVWPAA